MKHRGKQLAALFLALSLLLTACGGGKAAAATMHLVKTEGKVTVDDAEGKSVQLMDNLGLFSGYGVDTRSESYAWINLDEVKLTKMDQDSEVEIRKDGKKLEIEVISGSLFFHVTEPLEADETMEICASTMLVGIRGTCGWVTLSEEGDRLSVYLLEGKVRCEADGEKETVRAGEMAVMTEDGEITVEEFTAADIPAFVVEEIEDDDDLVEAILDDSGIDVSGGGALSGFETLGENRYMVDFEADGDPEYLYLQTSDDYDRNRKEYYSSIFFSVSRPGSEGKTLSVYDSPWVNAEGLSYQKLSLVESGGRLFIKHCWAVEQPDYIFESERYFGSVAQRDGAEQDWGWVEDTWHGGNDYDAYYERRPKENGLVLAGESPDPCSAEEYAAIRGAYNEIKVLAYSPDGKTLIMEPDPSEIEEPPMPTEPEPQQPEEQPVQASETISELPAEFTGEYTAENSGKYFPVTFSADGKCSGGGLKNGSGPLNHYGSAPESIARNGDGSVTVSFSYCTYTFYPIGHADNQYSDRIGLKYVSTTSSGYSTDWYYK